MNIHNIINSTEGLAHHSRSNDCVNECTA